MHIDNQIHHTTKGNKTMDKMNFYHRMIDVALKACGDCDIITRYDMQFNTLHRIYSARVWTLRERVFDVTEEEYSHGENFTVTEVDTNQ